MMGLPSLGAEHSPGAFIAEPQIATAVDAANTVAVGMTINGQPQQFSLDPRVTLLDLLREKLGLTGTKKGCDHGQCGACTVLVNGCGSTAVSRSPFPTMATEVTTIEGLAHGGQLEPIQAAFIEHDGFQCGYCTPGQICSAVALLREAQRRRQFRDAQLSNDRRSVELTDDEIRERMSGNICRCGAYPGIVAAVKTASGEQKRQPIERE